VPDGDNAGRAEAASTEFLAALRDLDAALELNIERAGQMKKRIAELERVHARGRPFREIVPESQTPLIVHLLDQSQRTLQAVAIRVRRAEVGALYGEGMTMEQIARMFGVTRQRVSALLRGETDD
jgi:DNA-directed RNA polymerase sigma subunit (sigma70/sigma32)